MKEMIPVALILAACMALGLWLGWLFIKRVRSNPIHIGFHLILGVIGLEAIAMLMRGTPSGAITPAGAWGKVAALVLALTIISGFATSIVMRRWSRNTTCMALAAHGVLGTVGFLMFLVWVFNV